MGDLVHHLTNGFVGPILEKLSQVGQSEADLAATAAFST